MVAVVARAAGRTMVAISVASDTSATRPAACSAAMTSRTGWANGELLLTSTSEAMSARVSRASAPRTL